MRKMYTLKFGLFVNNSSNETNWPFSQKIPRLGTFLRTENIGVVFIFYFINFMLVHILKALCDFSYSCFNNSENKVVLSFIKTKLNNFEVIRRIPSSVL